MVAVSRWVRSWRVGFGLRSDVRLLLYWSDRIYSLSLSLYTILRSWIVGIQSDVSQTVLTTRPHTHLSKSLDVLPTHLEQGLLIHVGSLVLMNSRVVLEGGRECVERW